MGSHYIFYPLDLRGILSEEKEDLGTAMLAHKQQIRKQADTGLSKNANIFHHLVAERQSQRNQVQRVMQ